MKNRRMTSVTTTGATTTTASTKCVHLYWVWDWRRAWRHQHCLIIDPLFGVWWTMKIWRGRGAWWITAHDKVRELSCDWWCRARRGVWAWRRSQCMAMFATWLNWNVVFQEKGWSRQERGWFTGFITCQIPDVWQIHSEAESEGVGSVQGTSVGSGGAPKIDAGNVCHLLCDPWFGGEEWEVPYTCCPL